MSSNSPEENFNNDSRGGKAKILVTGANGQLGKELGKLAPSLPQYEFGFFSRENLPIQDAEIIKETFNIYRPQYCINCAAYTAVDKAEAEKETAFLINGHAAGLLAKFSHEHDCQFIHISTDYVFDGMSSIPYKEDSPVNPQSVYGESKLEGERQVILLNPDAIIVRTSWVYSEFGKNFVKTMLKLMKEKKEISVVSDQIGSPTYAADLAGVVMQIIMRLTTPHSSGTSSSNLYHFSNDGAISWYDFALAIKELSGSKCRINPISTSQYPTAAKRPAYSVLDKTKIQQNFGIVLKDWKESLRVCIREISF